MSEPLLCGVLTLTPTHCGTGQAAGAVDLPIAREVHTGLPVLPASTLKGVIRSWFGAPEDEELRAVVNELFGPPPPRRRRGDDQTAARPEIEQEAVSLEAGKLVFLEGMLLAFPVRSLTGVFRWTTAPMLVSRLRRLLRALGSRHADSLTCPEPEENEVLVPSGHSGPLSLEDLVFPPERCRAVAELEPLGRRLGAFVSADNDDQDRRGLTSRLVVVPDAVLQDLTRRGTAVTARIVLDPDRKTSDNLWYEETLPPDTLFAVVISDRPGASHRDERRPAERLREIAEERGGPNRKSRHGYIGGNVTVGQGLVRWTLDVELGS